MAVMAIFGGPFCGAEEVAVNVAEGLTWPLVRDSDLVRETSKRLGVPEDRLKAALRPDGRDPRPLMHNNLPCVSCLRFVLAELLKGDDFVLSGHCALLTPQAVTHVLRVCLIAAEDHRIGALLRQEDLTREAALSRLHQADQREFQWGRSLLGRDPLAYEHFDLFIPVDRNTPRQAAAQIGGYADHAFLDPTPDSRAAVEDFSLQARVELALGEDSIGVDVSVDDGVARLQINRSVLLLALFKRRLRKALYGLDGLKGMEFTAGPGFSRTGHSRRMESLEVHPNAYLLPRGRRQQATASDRVNNADIDTAVFISDREAWTRTAPVPKVAVLDLRHPEVDGRAALTTLLERFPGTRVIVLSGHGSSADERSYLELGAAAFVQKPADISRLAGLIRSFR